MAGSAGRYPGPFRMRRLIVPLFLTLVCMAAGALPGAAQTTLGTIRGTVFDPQQSIVPGATVVATDEATNVTREAQTDAEGLFEIPNLRPGTYTVTASLSGFKKSQTHRARAARGVGRPRRPASGSRRPRGRGHGHRRRAEQHHAREPGDRPRARRAAASRPSAQQPRHPGLPHAQSRTSSAASTASSSSAAAPTARRTSRTASRRAPASSASCRTRHPASMPSQEVQVLSNSYSAEYGGLAGVIVSTKRGANRFHGTAFYDFNSNELNALTYAQTLNGVAARRSQRRHARPPLRRQPRRADRSTNRTFFFGNYEGSRLKRSAAARRRSCRRRRCASGDFSGASFILRDPVDRRAVPGQPHSGRADRSGGAPDHRLLLSAAEPVRRARTAVRRLSPDPAAQPRPRSRRRAASITS